MTFVVSGCMPHPVPAPIVYTLEYKGASSEVPAAGRSQNEKPVLKLMPVRAAAPFTSPNILYRDRNFGLNHYAHSRWSDAPVTMLEGYLLTFLEHQGMFSSVLPPSSAAAGDLVLESMLQDFSLHIKSGKNADAEIKVIFYLVNARSGRLVACKEIAATVSAEETDAEHAVSALNSAVLKAAEELGTWLAAEADKFRLNS